mmetsp:Transcript_137541/g.242425  ORF Transcript_137541/g.242425 Transcript_137541/m.242425 type:complete len:487 (+) Transcript_137541:99-1559(+)
MPRVSQQWADLSSDDEQSGVRLTAALPCKANVRSSPPSPCSTVAPASECACDDNFALPQPARWADLPDSDSEEPVDSADTAQPAAVEPAAQLNSTKSSGVRWTDLDDSDSELPAELLPAPPFEAEIAQRRHSQSEDHVEPASRPRFLRVSRDQKAQQVKKAVGEFLSLDFDTVLAEEQGGLVQRMLTTVKSLEEKATYWNSEGERLDEDRYRLLDLEEADMYAIASHVKKASKHCDKRSFRKAYDELCDVRPWLQSDDLTALRAGWESKKQSKETKKQKKQQCKEQEEAEGWQTVGVKSQKEAKTQSRAKEEQREQTTGWEVVDCRKKKSKTQLAAVSNVSQSRPSKTSAVQAKVEVNRAEPRHGQKSSKDKTQCQFIIGIEEDSKFRVVRRILGKSGQNMKHIAQETGAKLRLLGRGSGFAEDSSEPLMLCLSAPDQASYNQAKELVGDLIEDIYEEYREHCKKSGLSAPNLRLNVHEGYRQGAR